MTTRDRPVPPVQQRRRGVLWVSTVAHGGIRSHVQTVATTRLWPDWAVEHLASHADGTRARNAVRFVFTLARFGSRLLLDPPLLVHLHTSNRGSFVRKTILTWLAAAAGVPVVLHVHSGEFLVFLDRLPRPARRAAVATLNRATAVVALGDRWADRLRAVAPGASVHSIPNGIPVSGPTPTRHRSADPPHVVFVGVIRPWKATLLLLDAWARLVEGRSGAELPHLSIVGSGDIEGALRRIRELGIESSSAVVGWLQPALVQELLGEADILVLPSTHEGQPMVILEAMASGMCVIASAVGGIPDLIDDGRTGLLVPPSDVGALAASLRAVVGDVELRRRLGYAAAETVRSTFTAEQVAARIDDLYRRIVGEPPTAAEVDRAAPGAPGTVR